VHHVAGKISKEEYREEINQIIGLLEGKTAKVVKQLEEEIQRAAKNLEFEKAAQLRDKKFAIERITEEKQKVSNLSENNIDVIGLARSPFHICLELFLIRNSKMVERHHYFLDDLQDETDKEILSNFVKQHYMNELIFPNKIMVKEEIEDKELLQEWLCQMAGRKVEIKNPQTTATPPSLGMTTLLILLSSFGLSTAPIFFASFIVLGVTINAVIKANKKAIIISPHIVLAPYFIFSVIYLYIFHLKIQNLSIFQ